MAERDKNYFKRQLISFNPNFRIDTANPQMGLTGTDVYKIYGVTDSGDNQSSISLSSSGFFSIYNDREIQIVGGVKNNPGKDDILISGLNGNVNISAPTGTVRIYARNIMLEADEDIHFKAGRNTNIKSGSRIFLNGTKIDTKGISGNLPEMLLTSFTQQVFSSSFIGADIISQLTKEIVGNVIDTALDKVV